MESISRPYTQLGKSRGIVQVGVRNENYELDILKTQDAETVNYAVQNWNCGLVHQQD